MFVLFALAFGLSVRAVEPPKPRFDKVVIVIFENTDFDAAVKQPFFAAFAARGALLTDYHAIGHPSQPNYLALVSGDTQGVEDDSPRELKAPTIVKLLEAKGKTWKLYAEGYPGNCYLRPRAKRYARKHVPLISFTNIQQIPLRCGRVVNAKQFFVDLSSGALPNYSLFIPDIRDDGHDTGVAFADKWFQETFGPLLDDWPIGTLLVATFDEDSDSGGSNKIYAALVGSMVQATARSDERYDHYSLLKTIEAEWKLGDLGAHDAEAKPITGVWR